MSLHDSYLQVSDALVLVSMSPFFNSLCFNQVQMSIILYPVQIQQDSYFVILYLVNITQFKIFKYDYT